MKSFHLSYTCLPTVSWSCFFFLHCLAAFVQVQSDCFFFLICLSLPLTQYPVYSLLPFVSLSQCLVLLCFQFSSFSLFLNV